MTESVPNREQSLAVLDFEIEQLRRRVDRPGWTPWACAAAIGSLMWLSLDVLESSEVIMWRTASWWAVAWLVVSTTVSIITTLQLAPNDGTSRFDYQKSIFHGAYSTMAYAAVVWCVFVAVVVFSPNFNILFATLAAVVGSITVAMLFVYARRFGSPSLAPVDVIARENRRARWPSVVYSFLVMILAIAMSRGLPKPEVADIRLVLSLLAIMLVIFVWMSSRSSENAIGELLRIRRDIAFGNYSLELCMLNAERIVRGLDTRGLMQLESQQVHRIRESCLAKMEFILSEARQLDPNRPLAQAADADRQAFAIENCRASLFALEADVAAYRTALDTYVQRIEAAADHAGESGSVALERHQWYADWQWVYDSATELRGLVTGLRSDASLVTS
jgi:hypothetical protein